MREAPPSGSCRQCGRLAFFARSQRHLLFWEIPGKFVRVGRYVKYGRNAGHLYYSIICVVKLPRLSLLQPNFLKPINLHIRSPYDVRAANRGQVFPPISPNASKRFSTLWLIENTVDF